MYSLKPNSPLQSYCIQDDYHANHCRIYLREEAHSDRYELMTKILMIGL